MSERLTTKLRDWRVAEDLSLEEVADLTGLSAAMLSLVERGKRHMAPKTKVLVARRLGVPVRELFEVEPVDDGEVAAS